MSNYRINHTDLTAGDTFQYGEGTVTFVEWTSDTFVKFGMVTRKARVIDGFRSLRISLALADSSLLPGAVEAPEPVRDFVPPVFKHEPAGVDYESMWEDMGRTPACKAMRGY